MSASSPNAAHYTISTACVSQLILTVFHCAGSIVRCYTFIKAFLLLSQRRKAQEETQEEETEQEKSEEEEAAVKEVAEEE